VIDGFGTGAVAGVQVTLRSATLTAPRTDDRPGGPLLVPGRAGRRLRAARAKNERTGEIGGASATLPAALRGSKWT
jgi:hypothetical protein